MAARLLATGLLAACLLFPVVGRATESLTEDASTGVNSATVMFSPIPVLPAVGMSMKTARELLRFESMEEQLVGGACGMLQILTNEDESIRVIGVGGVVTSVNDSGNQRK